MSRIGSDVKTGSSLINRDDALAHSLVRGERKGIVCIFPLLLLFLILFDNFCLLSFYIAVKTVKEADWIRSNVMDGL